MDSFNHAQKLGRAVAETLAKHVGKLAYDTYAAKAGGVTHDGRPMPKWEDLGDKVRSQWDVSAQAVVIGVMATLQKVQRAGFSL
jgi:hypothetical protein